MVKDLLQKLISIPSYVDDINNEIELGNYIYNFLKSISNLTVIKEFVDKKRFNVLAYTNKDFTTLFAGHMDTVGIGKNAMSNLKSKIIGNKLYGRGSMDTKGGVAALLVAIKESKTLNNCGFLFYCGEEYDFVGMKSFLNSHIKNSIKMGVVIEPTNLLLWNAHRGLVEIQYKIKGLTGHASNSALGINANLFFVEGITWLQDFLLQFKSKELGSSTLNVSSMNGGLLIGKKKDDVLLGRQGNVIPDYCEFTIEVRTAHPRLNASLIVKKLESFFKKKKITILDTFIKHNLGALITDIKYTKQYEKFIPSKVKYLDGSKRGYGDGQMLADKFKIPVFYLGPAGEYPHGDNEYVEIKSLEKLKDIYKRIIV